MRDTYHEFEINTLHAPPHWSSALGVGVLVMGLAIGTGELILWPHLVTKYGPQVLWAAVMGILFQYFINQEVARHALATGESFFTSSGRVIAWSIPFWFIASVVLYIWPAWAGMLGTILREIVGFGNYLWWAALSYSFIIFITLRGRIAYIVLERSLKLIVPVFFGMLLVISWFNLTPEYLMAAIRGIVHFGYIPPGVDMSVLLGAAVFAGAGGML